MTGHGSAEDLADRFICVVEIPKGNRNKYDLEDLPELLRQEIEQFFSIYKELEDKVVAVDGWRPRDAALAEIEGAEQRWREVQGR